MVPFERFHTIYYSHSIVTMVVFCIISEIKQDIGRIPILILRVSIDVLTRDKKLIRPVIDSRFFSWIPTNI